MDALRGTELRIIRAYENLVTFKEEIFKIRNRWEGFILVENEPDSKSQAGYGINQAFPLPDHLSVYLGDFLQGLRSALDYAAWQCRARDDTYFPICLSESGNPASPHFNDEAGRYAAGALRVVYFYPDQLYGHTERVYQPGE